MAGGAKSIASSKQKKIGRPRKKSVTERQEGGGKRGRPPGKATKIAGGKRGEATAAILKYIAGHPDCKNSDIGKGTGLDAKKTTQQLTYMRKKNWVATKGKLRGMTYRIAPEGKRRIGA